MRAAFSVAKTRTLEDAAIARASGGVFGGAPGGDALMQRAANGLAMVAVDELQRLGGVYGARVAILVGPGNNGGDALFAGARLARRGAAVVAVRCLGEPHPRGSEALLQAGGTVVGLEQLTGTPDLVIDGILGIGGRSGLPEALAQRVAALTGASAASSSHPSEVRAQLPTIAVDLPSGVDTDTGAAPEASVRATRTVTFGTLKPCHLLEPGRSRCGELTLVDIGLDLSLETPTLTGWDSDDLARGWPYPDERSDKYSRGVVGIDTGSEDYPGAAILNTYGAVHAGAGMVRFLGPEAAAGVIGAQLPNVVFSPGRVQAHLLGSGWGDRADGRQVVAAAVESGQPAVIDADGLRFLPDTLPATILLTPHAGELARLLGCDRAEVEADPVSAVTAGARSTGATVLLKGATQLVAEPGVDGVWVAVPGPSWTGQAGSGDVLAGICAALLAAGVSARQAGLLAASLQATAAAAALGPHPPQDVARRCAEVLGVLQRRSVALLRNAGPERPA